MCALRRSWCKSPNIHRINLSENIKDRFGSPVYTQTALTCAGRVASLYTGSYYTIVMPISSTKPLFLLVGSNDGHGGKPSKPGKLATCALARSLARSVHSCAVPKAAGKRCVLRRQAASCGAPRLSSRLKTSACTYASVSSDRGNAAFYRRGC